MEARGFKFPWAPYGWLDWLWFQGWKAHHFCRHQDVTFGPKPEAAGSLQIEGRLVVKSLFNQAKYSLNPHQKTHFYDSTSSLQMAKLGQQVMCLRVLSTGRNLVLDILGWRMKSWLNARKYYLLPAAVTSCSGIEIIRKGCRAAGKEAVPTLCGSKTVQMSWRDLCEAKATGQLTHQPSLSCGRGQCLEQ